MKPTPFLLRFLALAGSVALALPLASAATLFWDGGTVNIGTDGDGVSLGTAGNWDTTLTNWDQGSGLAHVAWNNSNLDTALFGGTAATVTLTAPVTVGGLSFFVNSGYTIAAGTQGLTFGDTNNTIGLINQTGATSSVAISGAVSGNNVIFTSINPSVAGTLAFTGATTGGYTGTTTIGANMTVTLDGAASLNRNLLNTSGITLNGGAISSGVIANNANGSANRINDSANWTVNSGSFAWGSSNSGGTYAETLGTVALNSGQMNFSLGGNLSSGSQTLTLTGLTQTGTSAVTFSNNATAFNSSVGAATDVIRVTGAASTTAGQIIGPWATIGSAQANQTDYARYVSDGTHGYVVAAGGTLTAPGESGWGSDTDAYQFAANETLTADRTAAALRSTGATAPTIALGGFTLKTNGILAGNGALTVSGTGALTATGVSGGNLYLTAGNNAITVSSAINDNGGAVTVVKNGAGNLTLSSTTSNFSGGTVVNAGTLTWTANTNLGSVAANRDITVNGNATLAGQDGTSLDTLAVGAGGVANFNTASYTFATTTGSGVIIYRNTTAARTLNLGNASGFTGTVQSQMGGATNAAPVVRFSNIADTAGSALQIGGGNSDSGQTGTFTFNGGASLTFDNRRIEILSRTSSNWGAHAVLNNDSATANIWTINTDLSVLTNQSRDLRLGGTNTGSNAFNGVISNGGVGGTINVVKQDAGTWILGGNNTYTGATTISGGILRITKAASLGTVAGGVTQSGTSALEIDGSGGAVIVGTESLSINGGGISNGGALRNIAGDNTYGGTVTLAAQSRINSDSGTLLLNNATAVTGLTQNLVVGGAGNITISGAITTSTGFVSKDGAGTLTLSSSSNTYTGKTIVGNGTLSFSVGNASATADQQLGKNAALDLGVAATSSGRLLYTGAAGTLAKNINALGNGSDTIQNSGTGLLTLSGIITKNGTTLTLNGGANGINITGGITGISANSDLVIDSGTTTMSVANTYNGPTFIRSTAGAGTGILNANVINALPTSINRTAVTMDDSGLGGSQLNLGASQSIASLTGAASSLVNLNANTLTIGTASGSTTFAGVISGIGGSLTKDGSSILTLTNTNTYDGTTTVTGGILRVNGSLSTGAVNVSAGSLGGTGGTVNGAVTLSGTGGMNLVSGVVGDLTLASTLNITGSAGANSLSFDLGSAAGGTDKIIVSGAPTVTNNGVVIGFNQIGGNAARIDAGTYTIIQGSSAPTLANYTLATTKAFGNTYQLQVTGNNLEVVTAQAAAGPANVHWAGSTNGSWGTLNNWKTTVNSNVTAASLPEYNTNITFGTTTPAQGNLTTTLGADFNINSLTFTIPAAGGVSIGGANMLTLESSGTAITSSNTSGTNTISANVGMAASQSWSVNTGGTLLVSGNITDFGAGRSLTKTGAGTLRLSGNNTYSGGTTLSAGVLSIGSDTAIPSAGTLTIGSGTTIQSNNTTARSFTNAISIGGDFTVGGTGNLTFSDTGAIAWGTTRTITVSTSGVNATFAQSFSGAGGITKAGAGTLTLTGNNSFTGATTISAGTLVLNNDGDVTSSTVSFNASNSGLTITGGSTVTSIWNNNGGAFGGSNGTGLNNVQVLIDGAGTAGSARLTNVTNLNWGGQVGGTAGSLTNSTLSLTNGGQMTVSGEIRLGSAYYLTGGGANITIGGGTATSTFTGNSAQAFYIGFGDREGSNNNVVTVNSGGVLTSIGNMFVGHVNNTQGAGGVSTANKLTVTGTGTASMTSISVGYAQSGDAAGSANTNVVEVTNGGTLTTSGVNYIGRIDNNTAGATSNGNTLTVTGTGSSWSAGNQNVLVGFTNAAANAASSNNILTVSSGGSVTGINGLTLGSGSGTETGNKLVLNGGSLTATTVTVNASNTLEFGTSGGTLNGNIVNNGAMNIGANVAVSLAGNISGTTGTITQTGSGTTILSGTNSYTGTTTVNAGTLQFAKMVSLNNNVDTNWTAAKINVKSGGTLALNVDSAGTNGFTDTKLNTLIGNISVANTATEGLQDGATLGFDTSTATGGTFTQGNAIANSTGANGGAVGLTKLGTGSMVLDKSNTYTGATTVSAGTLEVSATGTINSTSGITIASGANFKYNSTTALTQGITNNGGTISGTGDIGVAVALNSTSDILAPGNSPGVQEYTTGQSWASFTYQWEVNDFDATTAGTNFDQIQITGGGLTLTGNTAGSYVLDVASLLGLAPGDVADFSETTTSWEILTASGGITDFNASYWNIDTTDFTTSLSSPEFGGTWSLSLNDTAGTDSIVLTYAPIPEPGAALLGGLGILLILRRRR